MLEEEEDKTQQACKIIIITMKIFCLLITTIDDKLNIPIGSNAKVTTTKHKKKARTGDRRIWLGLRRQ